MTTRHRVDRVLLPQDGSQYFLKDSKRFGARWKKAEAGWSVPLRDPSLRIGEEGPGSNTTSFSLRSASESTGWALRPMMLISGHGFWVASLQHLRRHVRLVAAGISSYCRLLCGDWHWPVGFLQPHHVLWRELATVGCGSRDLVWWC